MKWISLVCISCLGLVLVASAANAVPLVIGGAVVTPEGVVPHGWIVIDQRKIVSITTTQPTIPDAHILTTTDLIFPGFVDLHNHPLYNVIPRWNPPQKYDNRYEWRASPEYKAAISAPQGSLMRADGFCDADEFVEIKALIGGTTSIIGIYSATPPPCVAGLARNLDLSSGFYPPGTPERVRNEIGIAKDMRPDRAVELAQGIQNGTIDLLAIHIAEGKRTDAASKNEINLLDDAHLLTSHTALVHGTALAADDFARLHAAGAGLVWSPRSNMELYGETTDIGSAIANDVPVAIAPDWSPSGSNNTLAELHYASALDPAATGASLTPEDLFKMATIVPARIARIDDKVGALKVGLYADLFLVPGDSAKPYDALVNAKPQDVELVMVGGEPVYGTADDLAALGATSTEDIAVCGTHRTLNSASLQNGPLAVAMTNIDKALKKNGSTLAPLAECGP